MIGLGRMGRPIATRIASIRGGVLGYDSRSDAAAPPAGVTPAQSIAEVAAGADTVVLSLPDAKAVLQVIDDIIEVRGRVALVVDCSTIGVEGAVNAHAALAVHGIGYVDAAVSGGVAGADQGTLTAMCACAHETFTLVDPLLSLFTANRHHLGEQPGLGQAAKLANNFLSATALVATSEALLFGECLGIPPERLLEVLNTSTGRNTATSEKFPRHVVTGTYAAGFSNSMMHKDVELYRQSSVETDSLTAVGCAVAAIWRAFADAEPGADVTRIHPYLHALAGIRPAARQDPGDLR